jgi:hypothetical protein
VVDNNLDDDYSVVLSNSEKGFLDVLVLDGKGVERMADVGRNEGNVGTVEPGFYLDLNKTAIRDVNSARNPWADPINPNKK